MFSRISHIAPAPALKQNQHKNKNEIEIIRQKTFSIRELKFVYVIVPFFPFVFLEVSGIFDHQMHSGYKEHEWNGSYNRW